MTEKQEIIQFDLEGKSFRLIQNEDKTWWLKNEEGEGILITHEELFYIFHDYFEENF